MTASAPHQTPSPRPPRLRTGTWRTVFALMLREMSTRYGKQPGGYIWAFLEPLGFIVMLAVGFSLLLRSPSLGNNFLLFYATGYLPFQMYQATQLTVTRAITFSKPLLSYPAVTWIDTIIARFVLNALTTALVTYILLTGILIATDARAVIDAPPILLAMSLAALTGLGIGVLNCLVMGFFPTYDLVWSILTRPLFLASAIFYIYEDLPPLAQNILWWNPLVHTSGIMRSGFYPMYEPQYVSVLFVLVFALVPLCLGLLLLRRYNKDILLR